MNQYIRQRLIELGYPPHLVAQWEPRVRGIQEAVASHTVSIARPHKGGFEIGSGVTVEFAGYQFIVTARHLVKSGTDGIRIGCRAEGAYRWLNDSLPPEGPDPRRATQLSAVEILSHTLSDPIDDLAALVTAPFVGLERCRFHVLDPRSATPPLETPVMLFGYPEELIRTAERFAGKKGTYAFLTPIVQLSRRVRLKNGLTSLSDLESSKRSAPRRHYLLQFTKSLPVGPDLDSPRGVSGAGVWTAPREPGETEIWDPSSPRLVGIQSGFYKKRGVQKAIRIERLIQLLKRAVKEWSTQLSNSSAQG